MKKRFVSVTIACALLLALVIPASSAFGDEVTTPIAAGAKALLFQFSGLANLGDSAYEGGVGFKYYVMDPLAIRASLLFGFVNQGVKAPATGGTDGFNSGMSIGLTAGGEYHLLKTRVSPYIGATIGFTSSSSDSKTAIATGGTATETTSGAFTFNVAALGGVEFFIIKELSLSAEYRFGYSVTAPYDTKVTTGALTTTTKFGATNFIGITATGVLAIAYYF